MKATELVEALTEAIRNYGDLEVAITVTVGECGEFNDWAHGVRHDAKANEIEIY